MDFIDTDVFLFCLKGIVGFGLCGASVFVPAILGCCISPYFFLLYIGSIFTFPLGIAIVSSIED